MKINKFFPKVVGEFSNVFGTDAVNNMVSEVEELSKTKRNLASHSASFNREECLQVRDTVIKLINELTKIRLANSEPKSV